MKSKYRTCSHIKDNGVRCGSPAMKKTMFCFFHFRLYDGQSLPGDPEYCMPLLDSPQSIHVMTVHLLRAYLAGSITDRQMTNMNHTLHLALQTQRRTNEPLPDYVTREFSPIMMDVLGLDPEVMNQGFLTYDMDPNTCDEPLNAPDADTEVFPPQHPFRPTPETLEAVREAVRDSPALQEILHRAQAEKKAG